MTQLLDIPIAPETRPPRAGHGELTFTRLANSHTAITRSSATSPLRILSPKPTGPSAWAFTSNFGGGLVAGDHLSLNLIASEKTTAYLSTQSSTKIYRSTNYQLTQQSLHATIADDALLISTPDPIVCFAESRYRQSQTFHLAPRASLLLLDAFTSGRHANHERWQLHHLESRNEIFINQRRILLDNLRLQNEPSMPGAMLCGAGAPLSMNVQPRSPEQATHETRSQNGSLKRCVATPLNATHAERSQFTTAHFNYFATLLLLGPRLTQFSTPLLQQIQSTPIQKNAPLLFSASPLADGLIFRLAALNSEHATHFLHHHLPFLPTLLGEHPWHRKW